MKKVWIIIVVLAVVVGVTAYLNRGDTAFKRKSQDNAVFLIKSNGQEIASIDMDYIKGLDKQIFDANIKKSGKDPVKHSFTGVALKKVLEAAGVRTDGASKVIVKAVDGYTSVLTMEETMQDNNVYMVYAIDGKPLGKKEDGGAGPFEMVIKSDQFSQRWCKYVVEVEIQ
jgi:Sulfite oxidase and related enzymes